jgi:hypothetical protein
VRLHQKAAMFALIWSRFVLVAINLRRRPLREFVAGLNMPTRVRERRFPPRKLGVMVHRSLSVGSLNPRCLPTSLVLYRLLLEQGDAPQLVIGLPERPQSKDAHAWVEIDGTDVGPPPGRGRHVELTRYGEV